MFPTSDDAKAWAKKWYEPLRDLCGEERNDAGAVVGGISTMQIEAVGAEGRWGVTVCFFRGADLRRFMNNLSALNDDNEIKRAINEFEPEFSVIGARSALTGENSVSPRQ